jgi:gliding motility-associated-like protein
MVSFNVVATGSDLTYQWYVNEGSGFIPLADGGVYSGASAPTLSIFGGTRLMNGYVYHVIVSGCSVSVTSADAILAVNTSPEILVQPADSTVCMNAGGTFAVSATGTGITYQWQVNRGLGFVNVTDDANTSGSTLNTLTIINAPASFNNNIFRVVIKGVCGAQVYSNFATMRVLIPPSITLQPLAKSICEGGGPIAFTANGSGQIDSLRWQVFSGGIWSDIYDNSIYSGSTSQQMTVTGIPASFNGNQYRLSLKAKCTVVYSNGATLTVNSNPLVDFSANDTINACGGVPLTLNGNPSGGSGIYTQHLWTGDVGPLNNYYVVSPVFNPSIAGNYALNYKVRDSNGCYGSDDLTIIVDSPSADFIKSIQSGCTPLAVNFTKDMTGLTKFWWNFGDGSAIDSVNANPVHNFVNTNPTSIEYFDVTLTVRSPGGCTDSYTSSVMVYPRINATFTASDDTVCSNGSLTFTSAPGASKYFWDYDDGNSGYSLTESTTHIFNNFTTDPVTRTVTLTTTSFYNCVDVKTFDIVVMPVPLPQFTAAPVTQIFNPAGNQVTFTNLTNPGTWTWLWKFGDGSTGVVSDPVHTYTSIGDFNVTLIVSNSNCSDSTKRLVSVRPIPPVASFDSIPSGCSPLSISINNTSLNTDAPGTKYFWSFGDGSSSTAKNPTYTYFDAGIYRIELTVTGPGGISTVSRIVEVYPSPIASLKVAPTYVFVNDEAVRFFNLSQGGDRYVWEFGDGDTSMVKEPVHKYMEEGVYDITLWAYSSNGCVDQYILSPGVTVDPAGELRFASVFRPNLSGPIEMEHLPTGGDEVDQFFYPPLREKINDYKLQIFNRWGVLIYESHDINKPWNGYYRNELCPQGVYVWYVEGKYANGELFKKVGDITLLH